MLIWNQFDTIFDPVMMADPLHAVTSEHSDSAPRFGSCYQSPISHAQRSCFAVDHHADLSA